MGFTLTENHFSTKDAVLAEIAALGWHAIEFDVPAEENDFHWHEFDSVIFVLEGTSRLEFEDGSVMECGSGARVQATARSLHREASPAYRGVFGFSVDPAEMTHPVNKAPADLS